MGNKSTTDVAIKMDKLSYYPGQTINASIFINAPKPQLCSKVVLHIEGYEESEFRIEVGNREIQNSQNVLIRTFFVLKDFHSAKSYLHGQYQFPCVFTLPWVIPGSFKEQKGSYKGKIVYEMKVILVNPQNCKQNFEKIQQIVIRQPQKQIDQYQLGGISIHPRCLCFKNLGVCNVKCWFQKKYYLPNSECIMICQVDNTKSKRDIKRVKCQFIKTITLKTSKGIVKVIKQTMNTVEFRGVDRGDCYIGPQAEKAMLPLKYKNTTIGIHPSTTGNIVKCQYFVNVTPQIGGCFTKGEKSFQVKLHIMQPQIVEVIDKPEQWKPQVGMTSRIQIVDKPQEEMRQSVIDSYAAD